ncbi:short-chain specific acyl-CoA dehydrogenase, mitochondrial [Platysternon megacephalum]|uniref:Short-chain specific acyl-CoA dehydrogenase, mitochondrial n=1 Tax=Platysternon megacephalum TaxID=55544 RepID=A0A4D9E1P0_9SAUR|nr:short-chain specific acyl-CoA dehydrogenase, mitochondrial [Platysternon megacephalum]
MECGAMTLTHRLDYEIGCIEKHDSSSMLANTFLNPAYFPSLDLPIQKRGRKQGRGTGHVRKSQFKPLEHPTRELKEIHPSPENSAGLELLLSTPIVGTLAR